MNVKVLKKSKGLLKVEIDGEGHSFGHLLQDALLEDKSVDWAGYDLPHPLFSQPIVTVRMKGEALPEKALERASKKIRQDTEEFVQKFNANIKSESQ